MKNFLILFVTILLGGVALFVLVTTLLHAKEERESCEQFRFTAIQDVPVSFLLGALLIILASNGAK